MKTKSIIAALFLLPVCAALQAGTPAQDKEFVDKYKAAYEKGDKEIENQHRDQGR